MRTTAVVLATTLLPLLIAFVLYRHLRQPEAYRPGEENADVTSQLSRELPPNAPEPKLTDVTGPAGLAGFQTFLGSRSSQLPEDMGAGAAWGDFDNDGDDDLFLVSAGGTLGSPENQLAPCQLYENLGSGRFRQVDSFPVTRLHGLAAAWGDYDADGFLDLALSGYNRLLLFHNEGGTGRFTPQPGFPDREGFWAGLAWGDYDHDRDLDLYVCGYVDYVAAAADRDRRSSQLGTVVPYTLNPASFKPTPNLLLQNNGDGTFTDVAESLGVHNPSGRSLAALWHDFDDDGWIDLYVANDISDNAFFHNRHGTFTDISHPAYVADYRSAMGLAVGDWNRDGDDDLLVTHWVAQENALYDNMRADLQSLPQTKTQPPGPGLHFMDVADAHGLGQISLQSVGWGTEFADLDADGWLDLLVANGSTLETDTVPKQLKPQPPFLFWNRQGQHFHNLASLNPLLQQAHVSRGLALSDFDNDGDLDLLFVHLDAGVQLLRNDMQTGNWLKIRLRSRTADGRPVGFADGATVTARLGAVQLRRSISTTSYLSQNSRTLHFGLGQAPQVDQLQVRWPAGQTQTFAALPANSSWELTEGLDQPVRLDHALAPPQTQSAPPPPADQRARVMRFWETQRAAMRALKVETNLPKAIQLFQEALALDPTHEDSRYYLSHCLAAQHDLPRALAELTEIIRRNPQSHRAFLQAGRLLATNARSPADLAEAERFLAQARQINPEETGALLLLGQVSLLRHDLDQAEERLQAVARTNSRSVGALFLCAYLAYERAQLEPARRLLEKARQALGPEWQPKGATAEGDVRRQSHSEDHPLARFWEDWNGLPSPETAFAELDAFLARPAATP